VAARFVAGGDAIDAEVDDVGLFGLDAEGRDDRMQRPHPGQRAGASVRPSASISATESAHDHRQHLASTSSAARPAFSITAT
jgi:hypothetical protein